MRSTAAFTSRWPLLFLGALAASPVAHAAFAKELTAQIPPPAQQPVDFTRDIQPIFEASCVQCHARGKSKGAFSLETRSDFIAGGDSGPPAAVGHSAESLVVEMVSGLDPEQVMPKKGKKLSAEQVGLMRAWIDQGMVWPDSITFFKHPPSNLHPREVTPPPSKPGLYNPVDRIVDAYFTKTGQTWGKIVDDRTYARRVWLDTIGLLPPPDELQAFLSNRSSTKRAQLVDRLLNQNQAYAEHWLTFWNDLLRNDYRGTGFIDGGRKQITNWIYPALARNLRYDKFVSELLRPGVEAEGFTSGIAWRGAVNASMVQPMQAAQGVAQVFLGVNLKCASCHDSFVSEYTLADSYGLASVYADRPIEIAECDRPTGHIAKVKFLYDELGAIDVGVLPDARQAQLVDIVTGKKNGRLSRTIVNRLWQRFLGYGLVEPVDEMDKPAWSPEVLDWLAQDLVAHDYNLKRTMERILTSNAYQLEAQNVGEGSEQVIFRGPTIRRLSAEQFTDAVSSLGELTYAKLDGNLNRPAALALEPTVKAAPKWIWGRAAANVSAIPSTFKFTRTIELAALPESARIAICADDNYILSVNGQRVGASGRRNSILVERFDLQAHLKVGKNIFEVVATNMPPDEGRLVSVKTDALPELDSPAGLICFGQFQFSDHQTNFVSDADWLVTELAPPSLKTDLNVVAPAPNARAATAVAAPAPVAAAAEWRAAIELGGVDLAPWRVGNKLAELANAPADTWPVRRASLVAASPLTTALGRPNREQIVTERQETATTLQALELTNGATLANLLKNVSDKIGTAPGHDGASIVERLYLNSLGRQPTPAERVIAEKLVGTPARADGVQDLVWIIAMLPEFQLIR